MKLTEKTRRAARRLRYVTLVGVVLIAAASLFASVALVVGRPAVDAGVVEIQDMGLPPWAAATLLLAIGTLLIAALLHLARMLAAIEGGTLFAAAGLRGFAAYLFAAVLAALLGPPLIQAALALSGLGERQVTFSLGGGEALMLFVTGLLFFVARLLDDAQAIADDASQIV